MEDSKIKDLDKLNNNENKEVLQVNPKDVAIVGLSCRLPKSNDYNQYWDNLLKGADCIQEVPSGRWERDDFYSPIKGEPNKSISKWCGLIDGIDKFDNNFFNISAKEAINMDPQQRILMEETWHCIEDSAIPLFSLQSKKTSVYVGATTIECYHNPNNTDVEINGYTGSGIYYFMMPNRISYFWNFSGESKVIDTACASSTTALHEARQSLIQGKSNYAIVAGVHMHLSSYKYLLWTKKRMLSPEGKCKTFDESADGLVSGEGTVVLMLQRLDEAIKDNNHIYGVIKGSSINHGGNAVTVSTPRVEAQRDAILEAYEDAGYGAETVTYVEAHGTGTALGDPIEFEALTQAFRKHTQERQFCKLGSCKTNIGHLMSASGISGIAKVLMMLKNKKIPPTLNMKIINPIIDIDSSPFMIANELEDWDNSKNSNPLRAAVSSFGFGGVNNHILLEEYKQKKTKPALEEKKCIFTLSAKTSESLQMQLDKWKSIIDSDGLEEKNIRDICVTLLNGRGTFSYRVGKCIKSKSELKEFINMLSVNSFHKPEEQKWCLRIGQVDWKNASEKWVLLSKHEIFCKILEEVLLNLKKQEDGYKLYKGFYEKWEIENRDIYSFVVGYTCVLTLIELGFKPHLITGEKNGVWISITASGIMSLEDVMKILLKRKTPEQAKVNRPCIPFYNSCNDSIIRTFNFDEEYVRFLIENLNIQKSETIKTSIKDESIEKNTGEEKQKNIHKDSRLGALLIRNKAITRDQLNEAIEEQQKTKGLIGEILLKKQFCTNQQIKRVLRQQQVLRNMVDEVLSHYVDKARFLDDSQYTFKKFIVEWADIIKKISGNDIVEMMHDDELLHCSNQKNCKKKLLLMFVVVSSIRKLNERWDLSQSLLFEEERFYELLDLVYDNVLPREILVELLTNGKPDYKGVADLLNKRQNNMDMKNSYNIIKKHSEYIHDIPNTVAWIDEIMSCEITVFDKKLKYLQAGYVNVDSPKNQTIQIGEGENLKQNLLELWLQGFNVNWQQLYPEGTYSKVDLPVYAFKHEIFPIR